MANGTLKVGEITTSTGSGNITIGSGVTLLSNVPAFFAYSNSDQTVTDAATTKVEFQTRFIRPVLRSSCPDWQTAEPVAS